MNNAYEDIMNMTDEEAEKILEHTRIMMMSGRRNGKVALELSYNVAIQKAIQALKLNANLPYMMSTAAGAGYEVGRETFHRKCRLILRNHMETCENCDSVMPMMNEYYRAKLKGCPYCLSEFTNAGTTYLSEVDDE